MTPQHNALTACLRPDPGPSLIDVEYRDYVHAHHDEDGDTCSASTVLDISDEAQLRVNCNLVSEHPRKHRADVVPLGKDGATPFGFVTTFEWLR